jgi:hypothetical protein
MKTMQKSGACSLILLKSKSKEKRFSMKNSHGKFVGI